MKKLIALLLALVMVVGLVACGSQTETPAADNTQADAPAQTPAETPDTDSDSEAEAPAETPAEAPDASDLTIAMLPKFKGENYFDACKVGAEEAAAELGCTLLYDGPPQNDATNQNQVNILEGWIAQEVDVIIVSPNDPDAISGTLENARSMGIKVLTFDADANGGRDFFVNQVTAEGVAAGLVKGTADKLMDKGYGPDHPANVAMVSSAETDANQQSWVKAIQELLATDEYSWMTVADGAIYYPGPAEDKNQELAATLVGSMGDGEDQYQAVIGLTSMATPALGAAYESVASKPDASKIVLTGLATPNAIKDYILNDSNPLDAGVLWNCMDLGYLAVMAGYQFSTGELAAGASSITASRVGEKAIDGDMIILGDALVFDASNVEQFDY